MIKANELRKGNKVISKSHNILNATVEGFTPHNLVFLKEVSTYEVLDNLEPISLTPEVLEAAGFDMTSAKLGDGTVVISNRYKEINERTRLYVTEDRVIIEQRPDTKVYSLYDVRTITLEGIKYLHLLQNFVYSLTGHELTINLHAAV